MREIELLSHIYRRSADLSTRFPRVEVGPGDDCAVISGDPARVSDVSGMSGGPRRTLLKVDQVVEGRHFLSTTPLDRIAHKAIARPMSDIAAMAGSPVAALASVVLPASYPQHRADELFDFVHAAAAAMHCPLVGGDIASAPDGSPLVLSITIMGECDGPPILRSGARVGDIVYVTGSIGGSFGAGSFGEGRVPGTGTPPKTAMTAKTPGAGEKHLWFTPRIAEGLWLRRVLGEDLHAMMDISDGLGIDAWRMGVASGVVIEIDGAAVPLADGVSSALDAAGAGEDYELLFAASPSASFMSLLGELETPVAPIGRILAAGSGPGARVRLADGSIVDGRTLGYEHGRSGGDA
jgi:thiamine-monophosphate kinase